MVDEVEAPDMTNLEGILQDNVIMPVEEQDHIMQVEEQNVVIPDEEQDDLNKENVPSRPKRNRRRNRIMFDEETELTNEQIIAMRQSVVDDLDEAEIAAKEKVCYIVSFK